MTSPPVWQVHIDGAARGNPGPAAFAFIIRKEGSPAIEESGLLGVTTNNLAEYSALVRALRRAGELGGKRLHVHSDSELLVKQMNGAYRVKNADLRILHKQAKELIDQFDQVLIRHVRRESNSRADELCNQALDGASRNEKNHPHADSRNILENHIPNMIREKALAHLRSAAARWAEGDIDSPPPEVVWDQLWRLLQDNGIVPKTDRE